MKTKVLIFLASLLAFFMTSHATENKSLKVLVVYFSLTGNTKPVAEKIQQLTGADLFLIETVRTYPLERPAKAEEPKKELESGVWPELKAPPPDMSSYDLILVGGPVWWYTVSTPVRSFLQQADFAGKKVAPFVTHDGDMGDYFQYFRQNARNAVVLDGLDFYKSFEETPDSLDRKVRDWLNIKEIKEHQNEF